MLLSSACQRAPSNQKDRVSKVSAAAEQALRKMQGQVLSQGPHGETATAASALVLSPEEIARVKAMHATAAIVLHYGGNDWSTAQVEGLKTGFAELGIRVVAVTDANFKPDKQVSDIETVMSQTPTVIVSIPTDPVATSSAYKAAARAGTRLVFMDNVPNGLEVGKDYVSVVSADNFGNGVVSAHLMAKALGGSGKIGLIFHGTDFFVTRQRYDGFKQTIQKEYPNLEIVIEKGVVGPDFAGDAQAAANAMLTQHPDLDGIWAVWDVPAEGVMAAARAAGRQDLIITTEDLGTNVAIALSKGTLIAGVGAQRPFDQGIAEAKLAAYSLLEKKEVPPYVALEALPVEHANVLEAWEQVYHHPPPDSVKRSYEK